MPLSQEQFSALRAKGLSTEQIAKFDSESKPKGTGEVVKDSAKTAIRDTGRAMMGTGLSEFVPQLESPSTTQGSQAGMQLGKNIVNGLGVPSTPNAKVAGFNINPNSVSSNVLGGMLDPRSLLGFAVGTPKVANATGKGVQRAMLGMESEAGLASRATKAMNEAEKLTTQILQPTTQELADSIVTGKTLPSIKEGVSAIQRSKTFPDLVNSLKDTTAKLFKEREMIFNEYNSPIGTHAFDSLDELATQANKDRIMSPAKLRILDNVYAREAQYLADNPKMDVIMAQARKEKLQELTKPLLLKRSAGNLTGAENVELQAYDALRSGYRKAILKALPPEKAKIVDHINSRYEGLSDATEMISKQAAQSIKDIPQNILDKVAASFGLSPKFTAFRLATKEFAGMVGKTRLEKTTAKIGELRSQAELLNDLIAMSKKVKS